MAHNLATNNGKTAMMYTGDAPWHRPRTKLNESATAREAIEASGLNCRVALKSLATTKGTAVPQRKAVVRSDIGDALGVVGNSYIPVQNYQAFRFLNAIVAEGGLRYHTAGAVADLITADNEELTVREFKTDARANSEIEAGSSLAPTCYVTQSRRSLVNPSRLIQRLSAERTEEDSGRLGDIMENIERAVQANFSYR